MAFSIFNKNEQTEYFDDDFIEIEGTGEKGHKMTVRIENLVDYRDIERVQKLLREGNIVFLKIKKIKERDLGELKRSVERLRKTTLAMNGDIIGVDEDFLIITPSFAKVYRGEEIKEESSQ